ncbi:DUF6549 family protein [Bacteroides helcogenes]|uniref:Uncharacterized protein n=1 Tax=Bacteroides helcogenes (strain ATCC 35417 / DSM 20613 / JCM 6297 / CCUG 15421 / P 36-108) TaxID=693979 RepID=E6SN96_BACT6|nr:DUF6549 family protein [Bacteroides helcogenes]ADV44749.1 hypothetical protein Bache_2807 [Bacteroides helcogenes P 36-108]MDY5237323.1 DUF6549 family protein [Bacteroides helcogenes]
MKTLPWILVVLLTVIFVLFQQNHILRAERDRQTGNIEALMGEVKRYKMKDSLNVASMSSLNLTVKELKKYRAEDAKLIKELKLRPKDVEYITKVEIKTKDSLVYKIDTVGCFHYHDKWLRVDACMADSSMTIESRDSIAQIVHAIYKHRFLWWRWGVKGFRQEVVNFNPKSEIEYSEIVKISK